MKNNRVIRLMQVCTALALIVPVVYAVMELDSYRLKICKDVFCETESKAFVQNENIYINLEASDVAAVATLIYPDGSEEQMTFPINLKAEQKGNHRRRPGGCKQGHDLHAQS